METEKLKIEYFISNSNSRLFFIEDFILENNNEILLIGFDSLIDTITIKGILENNNEFFLYNVYNVKKEFYTKIINSENNSKCVVNSDNMLRDEFIKKDRIPSKIKYYLTNSPVEQIKTIIIDGENKFFRYNGVDCFNECVLNKPIY